MKISTVPIEKCIHPVRGEKVILAADLASIYGVPTRVLNQAVKRNRGRFPKDFCFQLNAGEWKNLRSQMAIVELMRQFLTIINPQNETEGGDEGSPKREIGFHVKDSGERKGVRSKRVR